VPKVTKVLYTDYCITCEGVLVQTGQKLEHEVKAVVVFFAVQLSAKMYTNVLEIFTQMKGFA
jgi:hypothetical protein